MPHLYAIYTGDDHEPFDADALMLFPRKSLARKWANEDAKAHPDRLYPIDKVAITAYVEEKDIHKFYVVGLNWNPTDFPVPERHTPPPLDIDLIRVWFRGIEKESAFTFREVFDDPSSRDGGYHQDGGVRFYQHPQRRLLPVFSMSASSSIGYEDAMMHLRDAWENRYHEEVMKAYALYERGRSARGVG